MSSKLLCPLCETPLVPLSIEFAKCPQDKTVIHLNYQATHYEENYFNSEYKNQYGKSYLDDRENLNRKNQERVHRMLKYFSPQTHPRLCEVGASAGFFLEVMRESGFDCEGWEISSVMTEYAKQSGLNMKRQDFFSGVTAHQLKRESPFDILAFLYVLEHFPDQKQTWESIRGLLRPGGILLLALPSTHGPTFYFNRLQWIKTHPKDHAIDYSPESLKRVGKQFGFKPLAFFSEGIHPNRFPLGGVPILKSFYALFQKKTAFSDTFFAVLKKNS